MNGIQRLIGPDEELISLTEATKLLPEVDGHKVAVCTLWRWRRRQGLRSAGAAARRLAPGALLGPPDGLGAQEVLAEVHRPLPAGDAARGSS